MAPDGAIRYPKYVFGVGQMSFSQKIKRLV
jgi:hypothetical protein